jgi:hypothetical protein
MWTSGTSIPAGHSKLCRISFRSWRRNLQRFHALLQQIRFWNKRLRPNCLKKYWMDELGNTNEKYGYWLPTSINSLSKREIMLDATAMAEGNRVRATENEQGTAPYWLPTEKTAWMPDGSFARWCIVRRRNGNNEGRSWILFLIHPSNSSILNQCACGRWIQCRQGYMNFEFVPCLH